MGLDKLLRRHHATLSRTAINGHGLLFVDCRHDLLQKIGLVDVDVFRAGNKPVGKFFGRTYIQNLNILSVDKGFKLLLSDKTGKILFPICNLL